ncbi:DNA-directed RNA polymerase subunit E'' [Candidatus Woesearchaeota archaeon CG10_big_fil_rev_8_21_14_0_10_30_7]|nr:MAG: DNA-directed RNA polymerase subunit E'' [Candidatus Woesearchaeota archaeon CG10_big_fil_rev_8_21_14_0_10_30_7]
MKKKACKKCKLMFDSGSECPNCKNSNFSTNWKGRLNILDSKESFIAKQVGIDTAGEYAIKVT